MVKNRAVLKHFVAQIKKKIVNNNVFTTLSVSKQAVHRCSSSEEMSKVQNYIKQKRKERPERNFSKSIGGCIEY